MNFNNNNNNKTKTEIVTFTYYFTLSRLNNVIRFRCIYYFFLLSNKKLLYHWLDCLGWLCWSSAKLIMNRDAEYAVAFIYEKRVFPFRNVSLSRFCSLRSLIWGSVSAPLDGKCVHRPYTIERERKSLWWRGNIMRVLVWMACANEPCYQLNVHENNKNEDTQTLATDAPNGMIQ